MLRKVWSRLAALSRVKVATISVVAVLVVMNIPSSRPALPGPAAGSTIESWFDDQRSNAGIPGAAIVVVRDGQVDVRGFGDADASGRPVTADTPFVLGSVSKSITAMAVGQLVDARRVELDAPVLEYVPEFSLADPAATSGITVRELLDQTSGIPTAAGLDPLARPATSLAAQVRDLRRIAPASAPGATYHYSNANYLVLGRLVEEVSGEPFSAYIERHVFGPLGMTHASATRSVAVRDGLGDAHRLFFGLADTHPPIDRPDFAPAGFVSASAADLGRYLLALMDPMGPGGGHVLSRAMTDTLWHGVAPTGVGDGSYAMGWVDGTFHGERLVAHAGSTTDMASFVGILPGRGVAVAVLFDAQSPLYELLHKPDAIGLGALALAAGWQPEGTLEAFYPAFDLALLAVTAVLLRNLIALARRPLDGVATVRGRARLAGFGRVVLHLYLDAIVPGAIAFGAPAVIGADWTILIRTDLGVALATIAGLRLADGLIRVTRAVARGRHLRVAGSLAPAVAR